VKNARITSARRLRVPGTLPIPSSGDVPYAKRREELSGWTDGEIVQALVRSSAWLDTMAPRLEALDRQRRPSRGGLLCTATEMEALFLFGRQHGLEARRHIRDLAAGDRAAGTRIVLGLDHERPHKPK
jgi:hypothetical protein